MNRISRIMLLVTGWFCVSIGLAAAPFDLSQERVAELKESLDDLLTSQGVPGLSAVLVGPGGEERFVSLGKADLQSGVWVGPDTRFRVGQIAETFLALGLLRIARHGQFDIEEGVDSLVPGLTIQNPFRPESPIRLANLLEQTSGLEDMPMAEYARRRETSKSILATLQRNKASLVARWRPGAYTLPSTLGALLAAALLEKQTGGEYAEWMGREVFQPLRMKAVYVRATGDSAPDDLATGYLPDGTPVLQPGGADLWPVLGLAASARDLQVLLRLLIDKGLSGKEEWLPKSAVARMETPLTSVAAQQGLRVGDGFGLRTFLAGGFVFYGFEGSVDGGWASFRYLPAEGIGYALLANGGRREFFASAEHLLNEFCSSGLQPPQPLFSDLPENRIAAVSGYYRPVTPRWAWLSFWDRIRGVLFISNAIGKLEVDRLSGPMVELFPVTDRRFRAEGEPLPTVVFLRSPSGRAGLEAFSEYLEGNFVRASGLLIWVERLVAALVVIVSLIWLIAVPARLVAAALGRGGSRPNALVVLFPSLALVCLVAAVLPLFLLRGPLVWDYGVVGPWSVGLFLLTILFAFSVGAGIVVNLLEWRQQHHEVLWKLSWAVISFYLILGVYLGYWGVLGLRTWQA